MNVSAVIVTTGTAPLGEIITSLSRVRRIDDVVVWDNSAPHRQDFKVWGRHEALAEAEHRVIYSQDDDIVHTPAAINRILDAYEPGVLTGCMWPEWSAGAERQGIAGGYSDLAFPGSGSVYDRELPLLAAALYLAHHHPRDDFFLTWCDAIIGVLAPTAQLDERFRVLPAAYLPDRLSHQDKGGAQKREAILRARAIRDRSGAPKRDPHELYMEEFGERQRRWNACDRCNTMASCKTTGYACAVTGRAP